MTTASLAIPSGFAAALMNDRGLSKEARRLQVLISNASDFEGSISIGERMHAARRELHEVFTSALEDDWDGMGSSAAEPSTLAHAGYFLRILPSTVPIPEISVDRDGEISFEWDSGPRQVFSVCVGRDGTLTYAGLFGHNKSHGVETMGQALPEIIPTNIERATETPHSRAKSG